MSTLFTKIIEGELPASMVWRDEQAVAFLTIEPLKPGHTLVVPVTEVDHWLDTPPELLNHLMGVSQQVGEALQTIYQPEKVGVVVAGLEVPHLHIHVLPIWTVSDLNWSNARQSTEEERETEAAKIRTTLGTEHLTPA